MDMLYHLQFRDWMEIDKGGRADPSSIARAESEEDISSGDGNGGRVKKRFRS